MEDLRLCATYYHSMGMNVAPIYGKEGDKESYKKPGIEGWQKQSALDVTFRILIIITNYEFKRCIALST